MIIARRNCGCSRFHLPVAATGDWCALPMYVERPVISENGLARPKWQTLHAGQYWDSVGCNNPLSPHISKFSCDVQALKVSTKACVFSLLFYG
jgi:hypothetical protein